MWESQPDQQAQATSGVLNAWSRRATFNHSKDPVPIQHTGVTHRGDPVTNFLSSHMGMVFVTTGASPWPLNFFQGGITAHMLVHQGQGRCRGTTTAAWIFASNFPQILKALHNLQRTLCFPCKASAWATCKSREPRSQRFCLHPFQSHERIISFSLFYLDLDQFLKGFALTLLKNHKQMTLWKHKGIEISLQNCMSMTSKPPPNNAFSARHNFRKIFTSLKFLSSIRILTVYQQLQE